MSGIDGVVTCYKNALKTVELSGPTNFAQTVKMVADMAEAEEVS